MFDENKTKKKQSKADERAGCAAASTHNTTTATRLQVVEVGEEPRRLREQKVADEHGDARAVQRVDRRLAAPHAAVVEHVVVHEAGGVDHLGDLGQAAVLRRDVAVCLFVLCLLGVCVVLVLVAVLVVCCVWLDSQGG